MTDGQIFVSVLVGISTVGWVITSWIRARHGYPVTDDLGKTVNRLPDASAEMTALVSENAALQDRVIRLEQRLSVLERIATDTPARLTAEIEGLR